MILFKHNKWRISITLVYPSYFFSSLLKMYFFPGVAVSKKRASVIKRKIYLNTTLVLKHIFPKHVIICVTLKSVNLLLEAHFIPSYNYANSVMENYPLYVVRRIIRTFRDIGWSELSNSDWCGTLHFLLIVPRTANTAVASHFDISFTQNVRVNICDAHYVELI